MERDDRRLRRSFENSTENSGCILCVRSSNCIWHFTRRGKTILGSYHINPMMWCVLFTLLTTRQWDDILCRRGVYKWRTRNEAERPSKPRAGSRRNITLGKQSYELLLMETCLWTIYFTYFTKCNRMLYCLDQFINNLNSIFVSQFPVLGWQTVWTILDLDKLF